MQLFFSKSDLPNKSYGQQSKVYKSCYYFSLVHKWQLSEVRVSDTHYPVLSKLAQPAMPTNLLCVRNSVRSLKSLWCVHNYVQEVDGESLMSLDPEMMVKLMGIKTGPALKIHRKITELKDMSKQAK